MSHPLYNDLTFSFKRRIFALFYLYENLFFNIVSNISWCKWGARMKRISTIGQTSTDCVVDEIKGIVLYKDKNKPLLDSL